MIRADSELLLRTEKEKNTADRPTYVHAKVANKRFFSLILKQIEVIKIDTCYNDALFDVACNSMHLNQLQTCSWNILFTVTPILQSGTIPIMLTVRSSHCQRAASTVQAAPTSLCSVLSIMHRKVVVSSSNGIWDQLQTPVCCREGNPYSCTPWVDLMDSGG